MDCWDYYRDFAACVSAVRTSLLEILWDLKRQGQQVVGYGAAAKATTMLSYAGIDKTLLDYTVDFNPFKHDRYMGINHLSIFPPASYGQVNPVVS